MSDLDTICEKANVLRVKHDVPKDKFNTGSGIKRQFNRAFSNGDAYAKVEAHFYIMYKSKGNSAKGVGTYRLDKNGNCIK